MEQVSTFRTKEIGGEPYIIYPELLPYQGKMFLAAPEKHNKSFFLLGMAANLASQQNLWGVPQFSIKHRFKVAYFDQELGERRLQKRLNALLDAYGTDGVRDSLFFVQPRNRDYRLDNQAGLKLVEEAIYASGAQVALFDPISKFYSSYDENDTRTMGTLVYNLDTLIQKTNCALVFAHHLAKPSAVARRGPQKMRGSTQLGNDADSYVELNRLSPEFHKNQDMELIFTTRDEPIPPLYVKRRESGLIEFIGYDNPKKKAAEARWHHEEQGKEDTSYASIKT